ncbi:hypothetical protein [Candidatus Lariskella endosymbiont of Hedychridium roseum]|uniref:hypothetical protein n=1 Tax=Candidatus Lariskella endosymbiont of Hedychridium roseum TaxID=3077949 RepID=UPI0030D0C20A
MGYESYELQTNDIYAFQDYSDQYGIQVKSPFADESSYVETLCKRINNGPEFCVDADLETVKEIAKGTGKAAEEAIKEFGEFVGGSDCRYYSYYWRSR